jgi:hypothetical protein
MLDEMAEYEVDKTFSSAPWECGADRDLKRKDIQYVTSDHGQKSRVRQT